MKGKDKILFILENDKVKLIFFNMLNKNGVLGKKMVIKQNWLGV